MWCPERGTLGPVTVLVGRPTMRLGPVHASGWSPEVVEVDGIRAVAVAGR